MRITHRVRIDRPSQAVWAIVSDLETHTRWRPALDEFRQVSDGPLGVGTRIREVLDWRAWPLYPKSLPMKLATPFLRGTMERSTVEEAEGLKRYAEEHTTP